MERCRPCNAQPCSRRTGGACGPRPRGGPAAQDLVALRAENDQLRRALAGRAVIDQARGMVMVLTPCRRGPARNLLVDMSRQCDTKLPEAAAALVATWEGSRSRSRCSGRCVVRCGGFHVEDQGRDTRQPASRPEGEVMIHAADVREWRNRDVVDAESHKIGVLEAVYVDTTTDEPAMATVRTGLPTRRRLVFVPLRTRSSGRAIQGRLCQSAGEAGSFDRHRRRVARRAGGSGVQALRTGLQVRRGRRTAIGAPLTTYGQDDRLCEVRTMHQVTTPREERPLLTAVPSDGAGSVCWPRSSNCAPETNSWARRWLPVR